MKKEWSNFNKYIFALGISCLLISSSLLCSTQASEINVVVDPSRTSCTAPCGIFFKAYNTTGLTDDDYANAYFEWDFGDPASGVFDTTGKSKNYATGFMGAHVYETPGTYAVNVHVKDKNGAEADAVPITINVLAEPPGGWNTICVSTGTDFTGCPVGASKITTSDIAGFLNSIGNNTKVLLRRGDSWTVAGNNHIALSSKNEIYLSSFGLESNEKPYIYHDNSGGGMENLINFSNSTNVRIENLSLSIFMSTRQNSVIAMNAHSKHILISNNYFGGRQHENIWLSGEYVFIQDCHFENAQYGHMYGYAKKTAIMGSVLNNKGVRIVHDEGIPDAGYTGDTIYTNNIANRYKSYDIRSYNGRLLITDNVLTGNPALALVAECISCDPGTRINLIERNLFLSPPFAYGTTGISIASKDIGVIRNNIFYNVKGAGVSTWYWNFDESGTLGDYGVRSKKVYVYNNHFINNRLKYDYNFINLTRGMDYFEARNNIFYAPHISGIGIRLADYPAPDNIVDYNFSNNLWYILQNSKPVMIGFAQRIGGTTYTFDEWIANHPGQSIGSLCGDDFNPQMVNVAEFCEPIKWFTQDFTGQLSQVGSQSTLRVPGQDFGSMQVLPGYMVTGEFGNGTEWIERIEGDTLYMEHDFTDFDTTIDFTVYYSPSTENKIYVDDNNNYNVGDIVDYNLESIPYTVLGTGSDSHGEYINIDGTIQGRAAAPNYLCNWRSNSNLERDFHLLTGSPAIDAGAEVPVFYDYDGNERPYNGVWDIGAYEYTGTPALLYGDVSGNDEVTSYDAALIAQHVVGIITLDSGQLIRADVSGNSEVTSYDAALIAQYVVGIIDVFPVEGGE